MPAAAPPAADAFLACLRQSGLVSKGKLASFMEGRGPSTAKDVATDLVAAKLLTRWQAEKILAGRCRGFRLGSYVLLGLLGKGGMSAVYLGEHVVMKRRCAIKVLPAKLIGGGSHLERFMREARAVAALDHPNIVRAYDVASEGEGNAATHFLVMELVEGRSLYDLVKRDGPPGADRVREIGYESAKGLAHAHAAGIVHRDVKPGNILLASTGVVKVTDLGLARGSEDEEHSLTVAHDEKVLGTADYLAPEQALDSHAVDHRADIYGLGCTLYFSLCGHGPFTEGTLTQRLMAHQTQPPPPIESLVGGVPPELAGAIAKMLEKKPEDRFQTMDEVAAALAPAGAAEAAPPAATAPEPAPEPELSDFLAGLPAEPGSEAGSAPRSAARRGAKPRSGVRAALSGGSRSAILRAQRTPPPEIDDEPSSEPSSLTGSDITPAPSSSKFDFLGGADLNDGGSGGRSAAPLSGAGSGTRVGTGSDVGSGVRPEAGSGRLSGASPAAEEPSSGSLPAMAAASSSQMLRSQKATGPDGEKPPVPRWVWIGAALAGLLAVAAIAVVATRGDGEPDESVAPPDGPVQAAPPEPKVPLIVGPGARFETIAAALTYLREQERSNPAGPEEQHTVRLPAGEWEERLTVDGAGFDFPANVTLRGDASGTTLTAAGEEPVVKIKGPLTNFTLENVAVEARGKQVAVEASGILDGVRVKDLEVRDLTGVGVLLDGVQGDGVRFERLTVAAAEGESADDVVHGAAQGVRIAGAGVRNTTFSGGSISGTLVGFAVLAKVDDLTLSELAFGPGAVGVRFGGGEVGAVPLKGVTLSDLKFTGLTRGVTFGSRPSDGSAGLTIKNCDFGDVEQPVAPASHFGAVQKALDKAASTGNTAREGAPDPLGLLK